jgi:uncharacterized FlgJ-related protein
MSIRLSDIPPEKILKQTEEFDRFASLRDSVNEYILDNSES